MSFERGMAALNLQMTDKVPRTEYSAHRHWPLISRVTGAAVDEYSTEEEQRAASAAFVRAWDYDLWWNTSVFHEIFGDQRTQMGHAVYDAGGTDFSTSRKALFSSPEEVYAYDMYKAYGERPLPALVKHFDADYRRNVKEHPGAVHMPGIYVTLMSGLIELLGWDMLLYAAGMDPEAFGAFVNRYADWILQYFRALARSESPVVMVHDDFVWSNGKFMQDAFYQRYIFPNYQKLWQPLREAGKKILFTADGDYTEYIDAIARCGMDGFVMEPMTDMEYIAQKYGSTHSFIGNVDTRVLLSGSRCEIRAEVARCMRIGKRCPGFFLAVGNHIPSNTPVDSALYYQECFEEMRGR